MSEKPEDYGPDAYEVAVLSEEYAAEDAKNRRIRALFLSVFGTESGKEVLNVIREQVCRVGMSCFDENPLSMARRAGRQEAAFAIDEILACAEREAIEETADGD